MSAPALRPTLGGQVCDWMEESLVHGPGDIAGEPLVLTDEHRALVWRAYELRPDGRRQYRRVVYSRRKGVAKTELAGGISGAELLGPVRCDGFDAHGQPVGVPVTSPDIPCAATVEEQAQDTIYGAAKAMLQGGPAAHLVETGEERTQIADRPGKLYPVGSRSRSRDGARPTFTPMDETHLWVLPDIKETHRVLRRNLSKREIADPWSLETTTAYRPGEESIAEASHEYGKQVLAGEIADPTLLFDHLEASYAHDITTDAGLRAAIAEASGLAIAFTNFDAILAEFSDPQNTEADNRRFWLNQVVKAADQWMDPDLWRARAKSRLRMRRGERITLGFDGSLFDDATALIGCRVSDGHLFVLGIWEKPFHQATLGWRVPRLEVDAAVHRAMRDFTVVRAYMDPPHWQDEVAAWHAEWGDVILEWWTHRPAPMAFALERLHTAVATEQVTHDGDERLARHIANARTDEQRAGVLIRKEKPHSAHKIDAAMAATLAYEARADVLDTDPRSRKLRSRSS